MYSTRSKLIMGTVLTLILLTLPFLFSTGYLRHMLVISGIWIILASSMNITMGYTGILNLSQAAMFGFGAYTSALMSVRLGVSFWLAIFIAACLTSLLGIVIGYPALRTRGIYFEMVTLGLGLILVDIFSNWLEVTGGPTGITNIPYPPGFETKTTLYYLILFFVLLTILVIYRMSRSTIGQALIAIREDEVLSGFMGINTTKYKLVAFGMSAFFAGIAGSLYAHYMTFISPTSFGLMSTFEILVMVIVGSSGTIIGPIIGTFVMLSLPEMLRFATEYRMLIYAVALAVVVIKMPRGLVLTLGDSLPRLLGKRRGRGSGNSAIGKDH